MKRRAAGQRRAPHRCEVEPRTTLVDCLREHLRLTGTHVGCEHGICGACTVMLDGEPVRSCLMFAVQADGHAITTVEGLAPAPGELERAAGRFCETHGLQCGYCTPGMLIAAQALLDAQSAADRRRDRRGDRRQSLPLHRLPADRRGDRARGRRLAGSRMSSADAMSRLQLSLHRHQAPRARRIRASSPAAAATSPTSTLPGMMHVAIVASPHASARIVSIDATAALAMPGVHYVLTGEEFCAATDPLLIGVDAPQGDALSAGASDGCAMPANGSSRWWRRRARWPRTRPSWSRSSTSRCRT